MSEWTGDEVEVPGCTLRMSRSGSYRRAVVILHGQLGLGSVIRPWVDGIGGRTVIVPDQRGRGRSVCRSVGAYSWERHVADVEAILDHVEAESAIVVGMSFGAGVALGTAVAMPDRVDGLVLWASPYCGADVGWLEAQEGCDVESIAAALVALGWSQPFGSAADLTSVAAPTVVIPVDDALHPRAASERLLSDIPGARAVDQYPDVIRDLVAELG